MSDVRIHKFKLEAKNINTFQVPRGSRILSTKVQNKDDIVVYCMVDTSVKETETLEVRTFYTGKHEIPKEVFIWMDFIDSLMLYGGGIVIHVFASIS